MQIDSSLASQDYAAGALRDLADRERMKNKIKTEAARKIIEACKKTSKKLHKATKCPKRV